MGEECQQSTLSVLQPEQTFHNDDLISVVFSTPSFFISLQLVQVHVLSDGTVCVFLRRIPLDRNSGPHVLGEGSANSGAGTTFLLPGFHYHRLPWHVLCRWQVGNVENFTRWK